jgi:CheY-like chemotaxis protein
LTAVIQAEVTVKTPCTILLVEDDENDALLFERTVRQLGFDGNLIQKTSPVAAWKWLNGGVPDAPYAPDLIVSDGIQAEEGRGDLLDWLRAHPRYKDIPFVVYTGGMIPQKVREIEERGALVVMKPVSFDEMSAVLRSALVRLPEHCRPWLKS